MLVESSLIVLSKRPQCRQSNMELLRIVAMSMILIVHIIGHAIYKEDTDSTFRYFIAPFFICGVNLFFLISGYFRIKLSISSLCKVILMVFIYQLLSYLILVGLEQPPTIKSIAFLFLFPVTKSNYWFMKVYIGLMLLAPMLNLAFETMSKRNFRLLMILFTLFTLYSCGVGHNICNSDGFSLGQSIFLYCFANWIRVEQRIIELLSRKVYLIVFFCITIASSFLGGITKSTILMSYNSIFTVGASVFLFIYFTRLHFYNRLINLIATGALGCYLLQDGPLRFIVYSWQQELSHSDIDIMIKVFLFVISFIGFWVVAFFTTKLTNRIINSLVRYIPKRINTII